MTYVLSKEQRKALVDFTPEQIREIPVDQRLELTYRQSEAFWRAVEGFAIIAIPALTFLGVTKVLK